MSLTWRKELKEPVVLCFHNHKRCGCVELTIGYGRLKGPFVCQENCASGSQKAQLHIIDVSEVNFKFSLF